MDATRRDPWLQTPGQLAEAYADWRWSVAWQTAEHSVVYRLAREGVPERFLKLAPTEHYPSLTGEARRMRWVRDHLPVPEVLEVGSDGPTSWLVTRSLPGKEGTRPELLRQPERLCRTLAAGLRRFHDTAPVEACPFDFRLDAALAHSRRRLAAGLVLPERDFHPEFRHLSAAQALRFLEDERPEAEDLVVCHGDYCPPNVLIRDGHAVGYVDLGELGVADRWWDLAAATWSVTWNLGPGHEEAFLAEYGVEADPDRLTYYRLLYDVVC